MIQSGDLVSLHHGDQGPIVSVIAGGSARKIKGLGSFDTKMLVDHPWGEIFEHQGKELLPVRGNLYDLHQTVRRKAQIIQIKDLGRILIELGVGPGDQVLESGVGSAAATLGLTWMVGDSGHVFVQELREDFRDWAQQNLDSVGLGDRATIMVGDLTQAIHPDLKDKTFDAVLLDQPEPWLALPNLLMQLREGARIAVYTPQVSQMEETAHTLQRLGFHDIRSMELIERSWEIKERGSRPSFDALGFTAFLTFARWLGPEV